MIRQKIEEIKQLLISLGYEKELKDIFFIEDINFDDINFDDILEEVQDEKII